MFNRTSKSNSPCRLREGPVTRLCGNSLDKTVKTKVEQDEAEDSSHESEKQENNDNSENEDVRNFFKSIFFILNIIKCYWYY